MSAAPGLPAPGPAARPAARQAPRRAARQATLRTGSLRRRVAVTVLILLVLTLTGLGLVVNLLLTDALRSDLRARLSDRADYAAILAQQGVSGQSLADQLTGGGVFAAYARNGQQFIGRDGGPPSVQPGQAGPPGPVPGRPARPAVSPTVGFAESAGLLTATVPLTGGTLTLRVNEADIGRTVAELRRIEIIAGGAALVLVGGVLYLVVGRALRPLGRMTALARRISAGDRGGRLRPRSPHTDLGRTTVAFDEMLDSLEAAEDQAVRAEGRMRQFLADASHDLRTPLAGVIAGAERILHGPAGRIERERQLVAVVRQARRAARLVDDLLLMARLDEDPAQARLPRVALDLAALVEADVDAARLRRPDLRIESAAAAGPLTVIGDPDQLHRMVGNLLDNALHAAAGRVTTWVGTRDGWVLLRITDDGAGVPVDQRERIFDRLVRLDEARSGTGSGLGLPISRAVAAAHGGVLGCPDNPVGACFEVRLPGVGTPARFVQGRAIDQVREGPAAEPTDRAARIPVHSQS